jgi:hypothetical protein
VGAGSGQVGLDCGSRAQLKSSEPFNADGDVYVASAEIGEDECTSMNK